MKRFLLSLLCALLCACSNPPREHILLPETEASTARGKSLVKGLAACGLCHGEKRTPQSVLSGGQVIHDRYGEVVASNLTPADSGLGGWTPRDFMTAMREFRTPEERMLSREVHRGYEWMSDADLLAVASYLRTLPPVSMHHPERKVGFIKRNTVGFFDGEKRVPGFVPEINTKFTAAYGEYLARHVARCGSCHDGVGGLFGSKAELSGGREVRVGNEVRIAPNITQSLKVGIGSWNSKELITYLQQGITPEGRNVDPRFCPVSFYQNAEQHDMEALVAFLKATK